MLLFLAGVGVALVVLGAWWTISHLMEILRVLQDHEQRLEAVERGVEDASAGVDQLTEDLSDLTRRALAVPPDLAYGVETEGDDEAPAG